MKRIKQKKKDTGPKKGGGDRSKDVSKKYISLYEKDSKYNIIGVRFMVYKI